MILSTDKEAIKAAAKRFDMILDTIPVKHPLTPHLMLLGRGGALVVAALEPLGSVHSGLLARNDRALAG